MGSQRRRHIASAVELINIYAAVWPDVTNGTVMPLPLFAEVFIGCGGGGEVDLDADRRLDASRSDYCCCCVAKTAAFLFLRPD